MRAIVHVGMPKTGSTTIQNFLQVNRELLARQNVHVLEPRYYPFSQVEFAIAGCTAAGKLIPDRIDRARFGIDEMADQQELLAKIEATLAEDLAQVTDGTLVVSCEQIGFWLRTSRMRRGLDGWLRSRFDPVDYVMFIRPMEEFLLSVHSEAIVRGSTQDLDSFIAGEREQDMVDTALDWANDFGDRLTVRHMGRSGDARRDLCEQFCEIAGIDIAPLDRPKPKNTGLNALQRFVLRKVNVVLGPMEIRGRRRRRAWRIARFLSRRLLWWAPGARLTESQKELIRLRHPRPVSEAIR